MAQKFTKAGVVGWPISHSRSPMIHNHWIKTLGLSGSYEAIAIEPENFDQDMRALVEAGYAGVNVTVPHKQAALAFADDVSPLAWRIGASNTLVFGDDGRVLADNTDAAGFMNNLSQGCPDLVFEGARVMMLGAGGAARAILCGLLEAGVETILISNRTEAKASQLAEEFAHEGDILVVPWPEREAALMEVDLLVNTTSLGMKGMPALDLSLDALPLQAVVTDIVYAPLETDLLAHARARGNAVVDGLGMLLHQAAPAFAGWFGTLPEVDDALRQLVVDDLEASS